MYNIKHTFFQIITAHILNTFGYIHGSIIHLKSKNGEHNKYVTHVHRYLSPSELCDLNPEEYIVTNIIYMGIFKKFTEESI